MGKDTPSAPLSLDAVRARIDAVDGELLKLLGERADLAASVAAAKRAQGDGGKFGLRPAREAQVVRRLLAAPHGSASSSLIIRVWREIMAENLARQGPFNLSVWGEARTVELARMRFGAAPSLTPVTKPEEAIAAARVNGGVAVLALTPGSAWWGRLLAEPGVKVFASLPCLEAWGPMSALAVADIEIEPTGRDQTFWVTDAPGSGAAIAEALGRDGVAGEMLTEAGGLKLFVLAGFYQRNDERLARAPGRLSGVIGAAPEPFDA